jgi:hypothetical protein
MNSLSASKLGLTEARLLDELLGPSLKDPDTVSGVIVVATPPPLTSRTAVPSPETSDISSDLIRVPISPTHIQMQQRYKERSVGFLWREKEEGRVLLFIYSISFSL